MNTIKAQTVRDIMTAAPVCVGRATTIERLTALLCRHHLAAVPVIDDAGSLVGCVSAYDVMRTWNGVGNLASADPDAGFMEQVCERGRGAPVRFDALLCAEDFMTQDLVRVHPDLPVAALPWRLIGSRTHRVIVVDSENMPVGVITDADLIGVLHVPRARASRLCEASYSHSKE